MGNVIKLASHPGFFEFVPAEEELEIPPPSALKVPAYRPDPEPKVKVVGVMIFPDRVEVILRNVDVSQLSEVGAKAWIGERMYTLLDRPATAISLGNGSWKLVFWQMLVLLVGVVRPFMMRDDEDGVVVRLADGQEYYERLFSGPNLHFF